MNKIDEDLEGWKSRKEYLKSLFCFVYLPYLGIRCIFEPDNEELHEEHYNMKVIYIEKCY